MNKAKKNSEPLQPVIELLFPMVVKLALIYQCVHLFNWIAGLIAYYLLLLVYKWCIRKVFGLTAITGSDKIFISEHFKERYQIISYMQFETFNAKEFKEIVINKMLSQCSKFRMKLQQKFYEHWWREVPLEEAKRAVTVLSPMKTEEDVMNHMKEEINLQIDIFSALPYEFQLIPYGDNKGVLLLKFDHLMSDGLGIISYLCATASNYSPEIFPKLMQSISKDKWYVTLMLWATFPFVCLYDIFILSRLVIKSNPLHVKKEESTGRSVFAYSKAYQIRSFDNYKKRFGLSFNDAMMIALSLALSKLKQLNADKHCDWKQSNVFLPVGRKELPKACNEVKIDNEFSVVFCDVPLVEDGLQPRVVQEAIRRYFWRPIQFCHTKTLDVFGEFLTWRLLRYFTEAVIRKFDVVFTNVPGPMKLLNYEGFICEKMLAFPGAGYAIPFIPLVSYNHSFSFSIVLDEGSAVKPESFIKKIEEALDEILLNSNTSK